MAICHRFNSPKDLHSRFDVVFFAHRHAAAGQDQIVVVGSGFESRHSGLAAVRHNAQITDFAAHAVQQSPQEKAVGVVNGPGGMSCGATSPGITSSSPVENKATFGRLSPQQVGQTQAGGQTQFGRPQFLATLQSRLALADVFAAAANPLPGFGLWSKAYPGSLPVRHQIRLALASRWRRPQGHRCARENAGSLAGLQSFAR
jgi:hypothetical protein